MISVKGAAINRSYCWLQKTFCNKSAEPKNVPFQIFAATLFSVDVGRRTIDDIDSNVFNDDVDVNVNNDNAAIDVINDDDGSYGAKSISESNDHNLESVQGSRRSVPNVFFIFFVLS